MRISLKGGAYEARSVIANAQRCVNLYPEPNPEGSPAPATHYPTPGLVTLATASPIGPVRGLWSANNGQLFAVIGGILYYVSAGYALTALGSVPGTNPVGMCDNGITLVVVNGPSGWTVDLGTHAFAQIVDPAFYGADRVDVVDGFLIFNKPGTPQFYVSDANAVTFDPLYFANKNGFPDSIATLCVTHREIWLLGERTSEVWFNSGATDFPFQAIPGAMIEQGCAAKYSVARWAREVFWLAQDRTGARIVVQGGNYQATKISTYAIDNALAGYDIVSDAVGYCYQQGGHAFYVLSLPSADATWCYDMTTGAWHERAWLDTDGMEHRHRAQCAVPAYGAIVGGDWQTGALYELDQDTYTDAGQPIRRVRSFPHLVQDGDRVSYRQFIADMEVGRLDDGTTPRISLRWSDTRGASWGNPVLGSLGRQGDYLLSVQVQRLGMARDRVFELSWSAPVRTALNGAFIEATKAAS